MRSSQLLLFSFFGTLALGCSNSPGNGNPDGGAPPITGLRSITVTPANQTLIIDGVTPATSSYRASGMFADGHSEDITSRVVFVLGDLALGKFQSNGFTSFIDHGGATSVSAQAGTVSGTTGLTLQLRQRATDPSSTTLPANPSSLFGGADTPARAPDLVYPNDGVLVPPNLGKLEIHFHPGPGNTVFELAFANAATDVKIYLSCTNPTNGGCIYTPAPTVWHWIAETNRGAQPLSVTVRGTDGTGAQVGTSNALKVSFSKDDIQGGLYYWTTSGATGIMRFDFASATQTTATQFIGTQFTGGTCVGCHALSRDGHKMVAEAGGQNDGRILLLDVATAMPMVPFGSPAKSIFESWEPSAARYVGVYGDNGATDWNLLLFSGTSGAQLGAISGTGTQTNPADHPDWSADGKSIAFTHVGIAGSMQRMWSGGIDVVTSPDGMTWSAPTQVVPTRDGFNHYYPAFSPDNGFVVFDESTCPAGSNMDVDCDADTDPSATLHAVPPRAGAIPIALARANAPGLSDGTTRELSNSYPKWSPFIFQGTKTETTSSRIEWLTFSSIRNYGLRNPPPPRSTGETQKGTLIWMAAVDPDQIANGQDGSFPAFALPFQDLTTSNHIAQWTTQVVPPLQ